MRIAPAIALNNDDLTTLQRWSRGRSTQARLVLRAKVILAAAQGRANDEIAEELGTDAGLVGRWRRRFAVGGLSGIEKDAPRGGRPATDRADVAGKIVEWTTNHKPKNATHWSTRTLAAELGTSRAMVNRVWRANGLKPHLTRTFKLSNDRRFVEKLTDVVGLYLNPPDRHQEWIKFLGQIDQQPPPELDLHLIADNYATHKHSKVLAWLKRHPRFHMHFTPTSSSWLNLVERWFREITDKRIRRGTFNNVEQLIEAINDYIESHNQQPKAFVWTASVEKILAKVRRAREVLDKVQSA